MVESGGRRSTEAASTLPGLMQQDRAEAGRQCKFPHPAARPHLLENISPLLTWCHVLSDLTFEIPERRSEPPHTRGFFAVCMLENTVSSGGNTWAGGELSQCTGLHLD